MIRFQRKYAAAVILYCAFIFVISAQSEPPKPKFGIHIPGLDKIAHAVLFGGLAAVVSVGMRKSNPGLRREIQFYGPIAFALLYGLSDEIHQVFVPLRTFEVMDLVADGLGALAAQVVLCGVLWKEWPHSRTAASLSRHTS